MNFQQLTGKGVRIAIIDSGVNPAHPHVGGVAGGAAIEASGESNIYLDYLGHGTAVAGAIREKAPEAELYAVKVFDRALATSIERILRAIDWAIARRAHLINLSLGTHNAAHRTLFEAAIARAAAAGAVLVAARAENQLPGSLDGVLAAGLDGDCPRQSYRCHEGRFDASGFPRSIPGVPPERNLNGISFAVANLTGFAARARQLCPEGGLETLRRVLEENALSSAGPD